MAEGGPVIGAKIRFCGNDRGCRCTVGSWSTFTITELPIPTVEAFVSGDDVAAYLNSLGVE